MKPNPKMSIKTLASWEPIRKDFTQPKRSLKGMTAYLGITFLAKDV